MKITKFKNSRILLATLTSIISFSANSQSCSVTKLGLYPFSLVDSSRFGNIYNEIINDTTERYYIILLQNPGEVPLKKIYYIKGTHKRFFFEYLENGVVKKQEEVSDNSIETILNHAKDLNGYYEGECRNTGWGHIAEHFILIDKREKISAEFSVFNGDMINVLTLTSLPNDLVKLYDLILLFDKRTAHRHDK
ncbi:MAG: hypothetical protein QM764_07930 [Chitinophagaceae bacterium]